MVSRNLSGIADQFDDMVEERDWQGLVALAGIGAVGGVLAEMFHDRVAPRLNQPQSPSGTRGLVGSFGMKAGAAVILGLIALRTSGDVALAFAVLGVGALVDAGVDLVDAADSVRSGQMASPTGSLSRSSPRQVRPAQQSTPTPTSTQSTRSNANMDQRGQAHPQSLLEQV